jgi:hypothetical protein
MRVEGVTQASNRGIPSRLIEGIFPTTSEMAVEAVDWKDDVKTDEMSIGNFHLKSRHRSIKKED